MMHCKRILKEDITTETTHAGMPDMFNSDTIKNSLKCLSNIKLIGCDVKNTSGTYAYLQSTPFQP